MSPPRPARLNALSPTSPAQDVYPEWIQTSPAVETCLKSLLKPHCCSHWKCVLPAFSDVDFSPVHNGHKNSSLSLISPLSLLEYQFSWCTVSTSDIAFLPFVVTVTPCGAGPWPSFLSLPLLWHPLAEYSTARKNSRPQRRVPLGLWSVCVGVGGGAWCQPSVPARRQRRILMANDKTALTLQGFHAFKDAHLGALCKASGV